MRDGLFETPATLNDTWGYKSFDQNWKSAEEVLRLKNAPQRQRHQLPAQRGTRLPRADSGALPRNTAHRRQGSWRKPDLAITRGWDQRGQAMNDWSYHFDLGAFKCVTIVDSEDLAGEAAPFFEGATAGEIAQACQAHGADAAHLPVMLTCLVVDTGAHRILVDTGGGPSPEPNIGKLYQRLQAEGIAPESVDIVVLTHWHWDHTWGATLADGRLAFPNARHVVWRGEWEWATAEANLPLLAEVGGERSRDNLLAVKDQLWLVDEEAEFLPGVRAIAAPGHTFGHMGLLITSRGSAPHVHWRYRSSPDPCRTSRVAPQLRFCGRTGDRDPALAARPSGG